LGLIELNRLAVFNFLNSREECFLPDDGHSDRTEAQRHLVSRMSIKDCLENLLNKLRFTRESDSVSYSSLRGVLKRYLDNNSEEECLVYLMSTNSISNWNARDRKLNKDDEIQQLFQGRNPKSGVAIYPGDTYIKSEDLLTIQIHMLNFRDTDYVDVPSIAIWVPAHMGSDIIRQS
jgi:tRNA/tmRNA/rRNA uracil-C5-methylase (TrmA/RlmC/RlmD family)